MSEGQELAVVDQPALTVFGTDSPAAIVQRVTEIAEPLADFIKQQHMSTTISDREYVLAEGWSFMGAMLGVAPRAVRVSDLRDAEGHVCGFEAQVELLTRDGAVVGGAIAECSRYERNWSDRDDFALKSMAQTRATGKAYRMAFGFVMKAAGYEATPAEEMPVENRQPRPPQPRQEPRQESKPAPAWAEPLKAAMQDEDVTLDDIGQYLGERPTNANIQRWLDEHEAEDVRTLVAYTAQQRIEQAQEVAASS